MSIKVILSFLPYVLTPKGGLLQIITSKGKIKCFLTLMDVMSKRVKV